MLDLTSQQTMEAVELDALHNATSEVLSSHINSTFLDNLEEHPSLMRESMSLTCAVIIRISYAVGIIGNCAAIVTLCRGHRRMRNKKHALMLRSLAINDLVALVGMMILMNIQHFLPLVVLERWFCALRVVLRIFGLGSVCIAIVMALERWLALTQPFLYQKHVTYHVVRKALGVLWVCAALLTCLPFLGFGIYYDHAATRYRCARYRDATQPVDVAYAYVVLAFGTLLCVILVWCNCAVIRVLCRSTCRSSSGADQRLLVRRISRTCPKGKPLGAINLNDPLVYNTATPDEIAFSKLMATLSVCFIICWMPQMVSILLAQLHPPAERPFLHKAVFQLADMLMLLNYTLDPYIYVLLRGHSKQAHACFKTRCFRIGGSSKHTGKASESQQDSLRRASQQDGATAFTTLQLTPPATCTLSPSWWRSPSTPSRGPTLQHTSTSVCTSRQTSAPPANQTTTSCHCLRDATSSGATILSAAMPSDLQISNGNPEAMRLSNGSLSNLSMSNASLRQMEETDSPTESVSSSSSESQEGAGSGSLIKGADSSSSDSILFAFNCLVKSTHRPSLK